MTHMLFPLDLTGALTALNGHRHFRGAATAFFAAGVEDQGLRQKPNNIKEIARAPRSMVLLTRGTGIFPSKRNPPYSTTTLRPFCSSMA